MKKPEPICITTDRTLITDTFKNLVFVEEGHKYYKDGKLLPSVSEVTHKYKPEFNVQKSAALYASKNGFTPEYWMDKWKFNNLKATTTGTIVHEYGEGLFWLRLGRPDLIPPTAMCKYNEEKNWLIPTRPKEEAILSFFNLLPDNEYPVLAETKVYNNFNPIAAPMMTSYCGTFDILFYRETPTESGYIIRDYKGLDIETPIFTKNKGWITMGTIQKDDVVYDVNGDTCKVINTSEIHHKPCYKITFSPGITVICDEEHRWLTNNGVMTSKEIYEHPEVEIPKANPLKGEEESFWEGDPYSFGVYLGKKRRTSKLPDRYLNSTYHQRSEILRGILDTNPEDKKEIITILSASLGLKEENWRVEEIIPTETIPTRCIEVDSPTHTYLFGHHFIPTHNTNKELFSDYSRTHNKMCLPPFSDLPDESFSMYTLQLSCYQIPLEDLGLNVIGREIIWLKDDGNFEIIQVPDLTTRIRNTL